MPFLFFNTSYSHATSQELAFDSEEEEDGMIAYSVPKQVRPRYCLLCLLSGSCANALPKRVHKGVRAKRDRLDI